MTGRDVFICHASEDKAAYARPLTKALSRRGVSCWVDEGELQLGDSLMGGINQGLAGAECVLLLITQRSSGGPGPSARWLPHSVSRLPAGLG